VLNQFWVDVVEFTGRTIHNEPQGPVSVPKSQTEVGMTETRKIYVNALAGGRGRCPIVVHFVGPQGGHLGLAHLTLDAAITLRNQLDRTVLAILREAHDGR
jgi:hypothetical protein